MLPAWKLTGQISLRILLLQWLTLMGELKMQGIRFNQVNHHARSNRFYSMGFIHHFTHKWFCEHMQKHHIVLQWWEQRDLTWPLYLAAWIQNRMQMALRFL